MPSNPPRQPAGAAPKALAASGLPATPTSNDNAPPVNRKKQRKRQNQAARRAAEQQAAANGRLQTPSLSVASRTETLEPPRTELDADENYESREGEIFYSDEESHVVAPTLPPATGSKKKKKKNKARASAQHEEQDPYATQQMPGSFHPPPPPPPPPPTNDSSNNANRKMSRDRIWNTSTAEERERIKEFWLSLEESQRRSLVKVEKEAVLKKMKEQQRNSCSCTVCGRKRTAIEEELEVLYDAYYEELEQYANHQQLDGAVIPPPVSYPHASQPQRHYDPRLMSNSRPQGRMLEEIEDDEDDDEPFSDEEDYADSYDDETRGSASDFFNFGNSLTVKGGILTVADDLLKNDGKKFIEMMEQLAERRMAREKAHTSRFDPSPMRHAALPGHDHPPLDDDDDYEDEDDLDYDDSQDDEYDEDMEAMSEEQRMEEGRRMFQIFAARMFEQRVLTAYREKVAKERQEKLLEELADESRLDAQREAKRAKEAQKKKDRKKQQKAAKEEERQRREAEKAAEEAAAKALEEKKQEEIRQKKEEQKKKKEAEKKAAEEERLRKEAEKARRAQELKDQQAENERRQKEQKEKEKRRKEDAKKKEREEREAKEREIREKKERDASEKREREARAKSERESKERAKREESTRQATQPVPVPVPPLPRKPSSVTPSIPPGLQGSTSNHASPHLPVATPAVPKASHPGKPKPTLPQETPQPLSNNSNNKPAAIQPTSPATSPNSIPAHATSAPLSAKLSPVSSGRNHPHGPVAPIVPPPGMSQFPYASHTGLPGPNFSAGYASPLPGVTSRGPPHDTSGFPHQQFGVPQRGFQSPAGLGFPPGMNGMRGMPQGRGSPVDVPGSHGPIGVGNASGSNAWMPPSSGHSRHASYEKHGFEPPGLTPGAIGRPAPIQRPSSISHPDSHTEADDLTNQLGSSALLDDADDGFSLRAGDARNIAPGGHRAVPMAYGAPTAFPPPIGSAKMEGFSPRHAQGPGHTWAAPQIPVNTLGMAAQSTWSANTPPGWGAPSQFGTISGVGRAQSRPIALRLQACQACRQLNVSSPVKNAGGFHHIDHIVRLMEQLRPANEHPINKDELLDILETEGNVQNGGGNFLFQNLTQGMFVKYETDNGFGPRISGAPGDIGSPVSGSSMPFNRGFAPPTPSGP